MADCTPTTEEVRGDYAHFQIRTDVVYAVQDYATAEAEFDRWLAAHDAEVRASVLAEQGHVVLCARCGKHPVVAADALNSNIDVCGDCGVQIGLHDLAQQGEPEWETERVEEARIYYRYGVNSGTLYARNTPSSIAAAVEQQQRVTMGRIGVEKVEARTRVTRTSPWLPVEENGENDA